MLKNRKEVILAERRKGDSLNSIFNNHIKNSPTEIFPFELLGLQEGESLDFSTEKWAEISELNVQIQIDTANAYQKWYSQQKKVPVEQEYKGIIMRLIPPGKFWMGSPEWEENNCSNETPHLVTLSKPFWCGKYPITQEQWQSVMGNNPSHFIGDQRPVERVIWKEINEFCSQLGVKLLSEAQWEYACRGGTTTAYSFGNDKKNLEKYAWYDKNSGNTTHPVGEKKPNAFGLYDMYGNVWERCEDYYHNSYGEDATDSVNLSSSANRVNRGGGWCFSADWCRSANRDWSGTGWRYNSLGLRVCKFLSLSEK